ncbi:MAG: hypothetical protein ACRD88_01600, partial [Terriglobia bacterium]
MSWERIPEMDGGMCEWMPASASAASMSFAAALQETRGSSGSARPAAPPRPSDRAREQVAARRPLYEVRDPHYGFAGIAVDPIRDEVIIAEENVSNLVVYDRLTNTPPTAVMSEPKRVIGGDQGFLEYACSVYVDPE